MKHIRCDGEYQTIFHKPYETKNKKKIPHHDTFLKNNPYICNDNPQGLSDILVKL